MRKNNLRIMLILLLCGLFFNIIFHNKKDENINLGDKASLLGDINLDGKVGSADYILVRKYLLKQKTFTNEEFERADMDFDGVITSKDYIKLRKNIIEGSSVVVQPTITQKPTAVPTATTKATIVPTVTNTQKPVETVTQKPTTTTTSKPNETTTSKPTVTTTQKPTTTSTQKPTTTSTQKPTTTSTQKPTTTSTQKPTVTATPTPFNLNRSKYILTTCVANTSSTCRNKERLRYMNGNYLNNSTHTLKSDNTNIVTTDSNGNIIAVGAGETTVKVLENNVVVATATVKVYAGGRALYNDTNSNAYTVYEANILEYGADPYGVSDSSNAVISAITNVHGGIHPTNCEASGAKGGVVFVPAGLYKISQSVIVSCNEGLVGELKEGTTTGSVFLVTSKSGEVVLNKNSALENLAFYVPNLDSSYSGHSVIRSGGSGSDTITVRNVFLVNSNIGMNFASGMTKSIIILRNIYGSPTYGIINDDNYDTLRLENIKFNGSYYKNGVKEINNAYKNYNSSNNGSLYNQNASVSLNTGVELKRVDWYFLANLDISGYGKAIHLVKNSSNVSSEGSCYDCRGSNFYVSNSKHLIMTKSSFDNIQMDSGMPMSVLYTKVTKNLTVDDVRNSMIFGNINAGNYNVQSPYAKKINVSGDSSSNVSNVSEPNSNAYNEVIKEKNIKTKPNLKVVSGSGNITSELNKLINELKSSGGVVYIPAGYYSIDGNINVASNVEIRGATPWLHDRYFGGLTHISVPINKTAFILSANSGINGISIEYDANISNNASAIVGKGANIYVVNTNIYAAGTGIDFASNRCDSHYVDKTFGVFFHNGIRVGSGSSNGIIRDSHFTTNQFGGYQTEAGNYSWKNEVAFNIGNSNGEKVFNNFVWGPKIGMKFEQASNFFALQNGIDYAYDKSLQILGNSTGQVVNSMLVSTPETGSALYIDANTTAGANIDYINNMMWGNEVSNNLISINGVGNHKFYGGVIGELKDGTSSKSVITSTVTYLDIIGVLFNINRTPAIRLAPNTTVFNSTKNICVNRDCNCNDVSNTSAGSVYCQ